MTKTLVEIDDEYLTAAQQALGTATKKDTVNAALREVAALAARRRDLHRLTSGGLPGPRGAQAADPGAAVKDLGAIVAALRSPASQPPANPFELARSPAERFDALRAGRIDATGSERDSRLIRATALLRGRRRRARLQ